MRVLIPVINGDLKRDVDYGKVFGFGISNDVAWGRAHAQALQPLSAGKDL
jgi:hypothetical protein